MDKRLKIILIVGFTIGLLIFIYFFTKNMPANNPFAPKAAVVNGVTISKDDLAKNITFTKNFYTYSKQSVKDSVIEKEVFEGFVEDTLIEDYAKKNNIKVSDEEVLASYKQKQANKTEADLLSQLNKMYGMSKDDYLNVLRKDLLREKVQKSLKIPLLSWLTKEKQEAKITNFTNYN